MIRNIVFDMGKVLLQFDPPFIASHFTETGADAQLLAQKLFQSACWESLDRGTLTHQEAGEIIRLTLPERLWPNLDRALKSWYHYIPPVEGMDQVVRQLKAAGYRLYVLTNANLQFRQYQDTLPGYECFDGILVSADHKLMKPEPAIYHKLAQTYGISLPESLFVDDRPVNIAGARVAGMQAVVFTDAAALLRSLRERGLL